MAVYQMHFAVTAEHRCTHTSADAFHYLVVLMCCSRPDPSTGYKTGAEYDNPQCQQDMIFCRHADDDADSRTGDSGQQSEQKLSLQYGGKKRPLFYHAHTLSKIICCRRYRLATANVTGLLLWLILTMLAMLSLVVVSSP